MSNSDSRVLTWLDSVPDDLLSARTRSALQEQAYSRKRPHPDSLAPLSPPTSQRERARRVPLESKLVSKMLPVTPSNKRRKVGRRLMSGAHASPYDNDETPTQPNRGAAPSLRDSETSSLSYQSSHASNNSSPSKMFSALGLYPSGVDRKQLDVDDPDVPVSLAELCIDMETIATGSRVVPKYLEFFTGRVRAAVNSMVFVLASTEKKVDYVFHLDPSKDSDQPAIENAALELRRALTDNSINHTSYPPLRSHPLSVSIETKRSGESEQKAQLQMGVWQAAQWKLLSELA
ncbi:hypothetical protein MRS44_017159 [Fusarium solani]|uniref:uncharacterized protein n=1 Tax=Fusarium solani TaxID=169388 RepID=UPI0032C42B3A|nr:hypothetical protein MRS44_017159 [Fusarium solani]